MQTKSSEIAAKVALARSVPSKVEPIDWEAWEEAIETPGVVEELRAEYER